MLSLTTTFWIFIVIFAFVGMMRGWIKEVVVTSSVILALFTINQFMYTLFGFIGWDNTITQPEDIRKYQFFLLSAFLLGLAFFGYQGPTLAQSRFGDRLSRRDNLQDRVLGLLVGALNGWFVIGGIWAFLENKLLGASVWQRYTPDIPYPFNPEIIIRPAPELAPIINNLPVPVLTQSAYILPLLLIFVFLFILVVLL